MPVGRHPDLQASVSESKCQLQGIHDALTIPGPKHDPIRQNLDFFIVPRRLPFIQGDNPVFKVKTIKPHLH